MKQRTRLGIGALVLMVCMGLSLASGASWISPAAIVKSL